MSNGRICYPYSPIVDNPLAFGLIGPQIYNGIPGVDQHEESCRLIVHWNAFICGGCSLLHISQGQFYVNNDPKN